MPKKSPFNSAVLNKRKYLGVSMGSDTQEALAQMMMLAIQCICSEVSSLLAARASGNVTLTSRDVQAAAVILKLGRLPKDGAYDKLRDDRKKGKMSMVYKRVLDVVKLCTPATRYSKNAVAMIAIAVDSAFENIIKHAGECVVARKKPKNGQKVRVTVEDVRCGIMKCINDGNEGVASLSKSFGPVYWGGRNVLASQGEKKKRHGAGKQIVGKQGKQFVMGAKKAAAKKKKKTAAK